MKMMKNWMLVGAVTLVAWDVAAQTSVGRREAFVQQQAYAEVQRLAGQMDVLQNNLDELAGRLVQIERKSSQKEIEALQAEIVALKGTLAELRQEMRAQRGEIVKDLAARLATLPKVRSTPSRVVAPSAVKEYEVQAGDTLSVIAKAFGTTVGKLQELNGIKDNHILRIGQKVKVPASE